MSNLRRVKQAVCSAGLLSLLLSTSLWANNETLTFRGVVRQGSCQVATGSATQTVPMGSIYTSRFKGIGTTAADTEFKIKLENCTAVNIANVSMTGAIDQDYNDYFAITRSGNYATGVALRILTVNNELQKPSGNVIAWSKTAVDSGELKYVASYIQTRPQITTGAANSIAEFSIYYR